MMCHRIGRPPISTIGFGLTSVSSARREPTPPASISTFMIRSPNSNVVSVSARRAQHRRRRLKEDDQVQLQGPVFDVLDVECHHAFKTGIAPAFYLPKPRDSG